MKKLLLLLLAFLIFAVIIYVLNPKTNKKESLERKGDVLSPTVKSAEKTNIRSSSIFIPYWSLEENNLDVSEFDRLLYFGISPTFAGINRQEEGYLNLEKFISQIPSGKEKFLVLRMIDDDSNFAILENEKNQQKIIEEAINIVKQYGFDGLALDLEISYSLNNEIINQISNFVQKFYSATKQNYRKFLLTLYGDTFYRKRPYDVGFLAENSDEILIMAYDFHKSRGEPGPNFPLNSVRQYSYSFKAMLNDFEKIVSRKKITVVFGMFGYDWTVDEQKRPIKPAEALSLNEIKKKFIGVTTFKPIASKVVEPNSSCSRENCVVRRDSLSKESEINYIISADQPDEQGIYRIDYHIVWFEDEESVKIKSSYLQENGIKSVAYWAYGYF